MSLEQLITTQNLSKTDFWDHHLLESKVEIQNGKEVVHFYVIDVKYHWLKKFIKIIRLYCPWAGVVRPEILKGQLHRHLQPLALNCPLKGAARQLMMNNISVVQELFKTKIIDEECLNMAVERPRVLKTKMSGLTLDEVKAIANLHGTNLSVPYTSEENTLIEYALKKLGFEKQRSPYVAIYQQKLLPEQPRAEGTFQQFPSQSEFVHTTTAANALDILRGYKDPVNRGSFFERQSFVSASLHHPASRRQLYRKDGQTVALILKAPPSRILVVGQTDLYSPEKQDGLLVAVKKQEYINFHAHFAVYRQYVTFLCDKVNLPKWLPEAAITHSDLPLLLAQYKPLGRLAQLIHYLRQNKHLENAALYKEMFLKEPEIGATIESELLALHREMHALLVPHRSKLAETNAHRFSKPEKIVSDQVSFSNGDGTATKAKIRGGGDINEAVLLTNPYGDEQVQIAGILIGKRDRSQLDGIESQIIERVVALGLAVYFDPKLSETKLS